ncbi:MAG: hypothetical protein Kow0031_33060 [Anaerolineae bacterium]
MTKSLSNALPWLGRRSAADKPAKAAETTPGGRESVPWVVVADNLNPGEATIVKGRLESQEIPAVVQQEALGAVLALTVGPLGSARVLVPEPLAAQALEILAETFDLSEDDFLPDDDPPATEG